MTKTWKTAATWAFVGLLAQPAWAAPVMNLNAPGAVNITAYPDHVDQNLYYVAPTAMLVAHDERGVPLFSYLEQQQAFTRKAVVQAILEPAYRQAELEAARAAILALNPNARFTALPFVSSQMKFGGVLKGFVEQSQCDHVAGVVGAEEACSFLLNNRGRKVLKSSFKANLTLTLQLEYSIQGVIQNADGSYSAQTNTYQMAGRLGGAELAKYPELFRDPDGKVIGVNDDD